jgi:hypothetical protein
MKNDQLKWLLQTLLAALTLAGLLQTGFNRGWLK